MRKFFAAVLFLAFCALPLAACGDPQGRAEEGLPNVSETEIPHSEFPPNSETTQEETKEIGYICVRADGLNVRTGAGTEFPMLGQAQRDTLLAFGGTEGGWLKTWYRGKAAFVSAKTEFTATMSVTPAEESVERVIAEGTRLLGTPYVYGAIRLHDGRGNLLKNFTADKFDCSSLMQYIFYRGAGIVLDVTTRTQVLQGEEVAREELKRGDLMFFTNASRRGKKGLERVGHVGLYLGGNYILHTASDFAKIEQLSPLRWSYFLTARRLLHEG